MAEYDDEARLRVLLVEDNPGDALLIHEALKESGQVAFQVTWVDRIKEALAQVSLFAFDVALLDLGLSDAQGLDGLRRLRSAKPSLPVVVLTGLDDTRVGRLSVHEGAQDFLTKGNLDPKLLSRALQYAIERHRLRQDLDVTTSRYRALIEHSLGLLCTHDLEGVVLSVNPAGAALVGGRPEELVGLNLRHAIPQRFHAEFEEYLARIGRQGSDAGLLTVVGKDGQEHVLAYRNVVQTESDRAPYVLGHGMDVTDRILLEKRLREESVRDVLTGCYNRRFLEAFSARAGDGSWGCIVLDIDCFKQYNDAHGHAAGDEVLIRMGRFLRTYLRARDHVVRMGGDEFLVLLDGADATLVASVAARLREEAPARAPAAFTIGEATREGSEILTETIDRADRKLMLVRVAERPFGTRRRRTTGQT